MALAGRMTLPVVAAEASEPTAGEILQGINMFTPEEGDPAYKVKANEKYGTQWAVDMAYGYWHSNNTSPDVHDNANLFLIHALLNQRLIEDNMNGGTWLRVEFSGPGGWIPILIRPAACSAREPAAPPIRMPISTEGTRVCSRKLRSCSISTTSAPASSPVW